MKKSFIASLLCTGMLCWSALAQAAEIKPTLHITKPKSGELWTNLIFTILGQGAPAKHSGA